MQYVTKVLRSFIKLIKDKINGSNMYAGFAFQSGRLDYAVSIT